MEADGDQPQSISPAGGRKKPSAKWAFALVATMAVLPIAAIVVPDAGVLLIEGGRPEAGKKVINLIGGRQAGLNSELFAQVYAGNADLTKYLLDHGAKADLDDVGHAIKHKRPDIVGLLLDKYPSMAQSTLIGGIINEEGTVEILEVAKAHGAKLGFEALEVAARGRPDLLPWVIEHGTYAAADVMEAQKSAISNDHLDSFTRLHALAEPDDATKADLLKFSVHNPETLEALLKDVSFGAPALRAGLADALERGNEASFGLLKARLPQSTVNEVVRTAVAKTDAPTRLLIREAAKLPAPQTFNPALH